MKKILTFVMVSALCVTMLTAASSAEKLYNDFKTAVDNGDTTTAMKKYSELESRVDKENTSKEKSLEIKEKTKEKETISKKEKKNNE